MNQHNKTRVKFPQFRLEFQEVAGDMSPWKEQLNQVKL